MNFVIHWNETALGPVVFKCKSRKAETSSLKGFPGGMSGKESIWRCRRCGFNPWVGKIPWRRAWPPTPVFLPGDPMDCSPPGLSELDMTDVTKHTGPLAEKKEKYKLKLMSIFLKIK